MDLDQVCVLLALVPPVAVGGLLLRSTSVVLQVRAAGDSAALSSPSSVDPQGVQCLVWMAAHRSRPRSPPTVRAASGRTAVLVFMSFHSSAGRRNCDRSVSS